MPYDSQLPLRNPIYKDARRKQQIRFISTWVYAQAWRLTSQKRNFRNSFGSPAGRIRVLPKSNGISDSQIVSFRTTTRR